MAPATSPRISWKDMGQGGQSHRPCWPMAHTRELVSPRPIFLNHLLTLEPSMAPHSLGSKSKSLHYTPHAGPVCSLPTPPQATSSPNWGVRLRLCTPVCSTA